MCLARGLAFGTAPPGLLLEVKDPEVLVTDALCEETDTPKENRVHLVCDENTDACAVNVDRNPVSDRNSSQVLESPIASTIRNSSLGNR